MRCLAAALALTGTTLISTGAGASVPAQEEIEISGEVDGLYPGLIKSLEVEVLNNQEFTIRVTSVGATVGDASPTCPAAFLTVDGSTTPVDVPPHATGSIPLVVHLARVTPDSCQGATWPLAFTATADEATADEAPPTATPPAEAVGTPTSLAPSGITGAFSLGAPISLALTGATVATLAGIALVLIGIGALLQRRTRRPVERNAS